MKSSTWTSDFGATVIGVGVDAEMMDRFELDEKPGNPLPLVFSDAEVVRAASTPDPAMALCAAFCFKEALFKAIGVPFNPLHVKWMAGNEPGSGEALLDPDVARELGIVSLSVRVLFPHPGECVTIVHVFGE